MSGSIFGNLDISDNYLELAKKQARLVNCPDSTPSEIVECLRTKPTDELVNSFFGFYVRFCCFNKVLFVINFVVL